MNHTFASSDVPAGASTAAADPSGAPQLRITTLATSAGMQLEVAGELDLATAPLLVQAVAAVLAPASGAHLHPGAPSSSKSGSARPGGKQDRSPAAVQVVVDLAALTFLDVAGLNALLAVTDQVRSVGGSLVVRGEPPTAHLLMELTGTLAALHTGPGASLSNGVTSPRVCGGSDGMTRQPVPVGTRRSTKTPEASARTTDEPGTADETATQMTQRSGA